MGSLSLKSASLWGYAEADSTVVAIVVAVVILLAGLYVFFRLSGKNRPADKQNQADDRG